MKDITLIRGLLKNDADKKVLDSALKEKYITESGYKVGDIIETPHGGKLEVKSISVCVSLRDKAIQLQFWGYQLDKFGNVKRDLDNERCVTGVWKNGKEVKNL